jgi:ADP-L-glycero-D-manno-heptose 6-epimerase
MEHRPASALYNLGSGTARSFIELGTAVFRSMGLEPRIEYIDIPPDIRQAYQYFTEAHMEKLRSVGYNTPFYSLEDGIHDYLHNYLLPGHPL